MSTIREYWERLRWRLSDWAERLSAWLHPGYRIAPLTPRTYDRFMAFWREVGLDDAYESAHSNDTLPNDGIGLEGLSGLGDDEATISEEQAEKIRRKFEEEGRLTELTATMFDVPEHRAGDIPLGLVEDVLANFIIACAKHRLKLLGMRDATTSTSAQAEETLSASTSAP